MPYTAVTAEIPTAEPTAAPNGVAVAGRPPASPCFSG